MDRLQTCLYIGLQDKLLRQRLNTQVQYRHCHSWPRYPSTYWLHRANRCLVGKLPIHSPNSLIRTTLCPQARTR